MIVVVVVAVVVVVVAVVVDIFFLIKILLLETLDLASSLPSRRGAYTRYKSCSHWGPGMTFQNSFLLLLPIFPLKCVIVVKVRFLDC